MNIDGRTAAAPPGGVPTLAIWAGRGSPGRSIGGALNVTVPNQTHVESATSRESFGAMFKFFTGHKPGTLDIVPEHGRVRVAGRAVLFPSNVGVTGNRTIEVWRVHGSTGQRVGGRPRYVAHAGRRRRLGTGVAASRDATTSSRSSGQARASITSTTSRSCAATTWFAC